MSGILRHKLLDERENVDFHSDKLLHVHKCSDSSLIYTMLDLNIRNIQSKWHLNE